MNKQFLNYLQVQRRTKILQNIVEIQWLFFFSLLFLFFLLKSHVVTLVQSKSSFVLSRGQQKIEPNNQLLGIQPEQKNQHTGNHRRRQNFRYWNTFATAQLYLNNLIESKVENILKGSLDWILQPSVKIQIMGGKICLGCKL